MLTTNLEDEFVQNSISNLIFSLKSNFTFVLELPLIKKIRQN